VAAVVAASGLLLLLLIPQLDMALLSLGVLLRKLLLLLVSVAVVLLIMHFLDDYLGLGLLSSGAASRLLLVLGQFRVLRAAGHLLRLVSAVLC